MTKGLILLVEDEPMLHFLWEDICALADIEIAGIAMTSGEALEIIDKHGSNLTGVILDVNLHDGTSQPVAEKLRGMGIHVVVCSGSDSNALHDCYAGWEVLMKPYRPQEAQDHLKKMVYLF
jgi:response regulator of citrate/malate metabolism